MPRLRTRVVVSLLALGLLAAGCSRESPTAPVSARVSPNSATVQATTAGKLSSFPLPAAFSFPGSIVAGPNSTLWFVEGGKIGRMTTAGALQEFALPTGHSAANITPGPDGAMWFTEPTSSRIGRISTTGAITEYVVPGACTAGYSCPMSPRPQSIVAGPDGALWFTEPIFSKSLSRVAAGKIVRLTTGGSFTEFAIPGGSAKVQTPNPGSIAVGADGALWFTDLFERRIWRITTSGALSFYAVPLGQPISIAAGPDGALWFTSSNANPAQLGRISTSGAITMRSVAAGMNGSSLGAIAAGPDGNLWFTQYDMTSSSGNIVRSTPAGVMTKFAFATYVEIDGITRGPDAAVWFTQSNNQTGAANIGRMSTQ